MSWKGTPYRAGQQRKGAGVDCVRFVTAVFDELEGGQTDIRILPQDLALHQPEIARGAMRQLLRAFDGRSLPDGYLELEPGDVIVSGFPQGGPGHAMIVGPWPQVWHSCRSGVVMTGLGLEGLSFKSLVRSNRKHLWI